MGKRSLGSTPKRYGEFASFEVLNLVDFEPCRTKPEGHHLIFETQPYMGIGCAQFLALMRREIDNKKSAMGREHSSSLCDRSCRRVGIMKDLVDDDIVSTLVRKGKRVHVTLTQARLNTGGFKLDPRQAQHFRRAVNPYCLFRTRAKQFDHPAGAGANVHQPSKRRAAKRTINRLLNFALRDVERADLIPNLGMACKIAIGCFGAFTADRFGPGGI